MSQIDLIELGERIKQARREQRKSQADTAAVTGVSRARIEAFENGRAPDMSISSVIRLMNAVGLDFRLTHFNSGRPTLADIRAQEQEEEEGHAPGMGR